MDKLKEILQKTWHTGRWVLLILLLASTILYLIGINATKTAVRHITNTHLTMQDVTGETLPPKRTKEEYDATVEGLDENNNGIRDDVEHAIFEMSGDSSQMRAAKLQYAQAYQLLFTYVFDGDTLEAYGQKYIQSTKCIRSTMKKEGLGLLSFKIEDPIDALILNTKSRKLSAEKHSWYDTQYSKDINLPEERCHVIFKNE